jgi:hypothetical protein
MKRVFRIDQECYVIFLEDFSNSKDRFLRIGNSPFFKDFNKNLVFVDLISKLLPGDPKLELELFNPDVDKEVIGLKDILINYLTFLKKNGINIDNVKKISAQDKSRRVIIQKSEEDFINEIKKNKKYQDYSFASFYKDGNIRIFKQNEEIFDLKKLQNEYFDEYEEIKETSKFYKDYEKAYSKNGFIHSNESLFFFSKNEFFCLTKSANWIKDAIRVGINPFNVKIIYLGEKNTLSSYFYRIILSKFSYKSKIIIAFRRKDFALEYRFSKEFFIPVFPVANAEQNEFKLNDFSIKFGTDKTIVTYKNLIFNLDYQNNYLEKGFIINCKNSANGKVENTKLVLEEYKKNHISIYSYNPVVFYDSLADNNYINKFWNKISDSNKKDFIKEIFENDDKYINYEFQTEKISSFYNKLFIETIRRIIIEGKVNVSDEKLNKYADALDNFNGREINKNNLIMEQSLGILSINQKLGVRDSFFTKELNYIDDEMNPFMTFEKELSIQEWVKKQQDYRDRFKKYIKNPETSRLIDNRFAEIIKNKKFYKEEQDRLLRFMSKVMINEEKKDETETVAKEANTVYTDTSSKGKTVNDAYLKINSKTENNNKKFKENKKFKIKYLIAALLGLLLLGLIILGILYGPKISKNIYIAINNKIHNDNTTDITQDDYFKNSKDKYDEKTDANKTSEHYKFYMTNLDLLNLTNLVAERNNYHKIVYSYQKKYVKGKDPDWIFPGNKLTMPNSTVIQIKPGDTMWDICDSYLIDEINNHEKKIRELIEKTKLNKMLITEAQKEFMVIKSQSHSQMMKDFLDTLINLKSFKHWEPYIDEIKNKTKNQ